MMIRIVFPEGFDERAEHEAFTRGYLSHARVELEDGRLFAVFFVDPVRLLQEVEDLANRESFFAEIGLIVVPKVTRNVMENAVRDLARRGFFDYFRPLAEGDCPWNV